MRPSDLLPDASHGDDLTRHVGAPPAAVFAALTRWFPGQAPLTAALLTLRDWPARLVGGRGGMRQLAAGPPPPLHVAAPRRLAIGMAARPWHPDVGLVLLDARAFAAYSRPGYCKILWDFTVGLTPGGATLRLATRVRALGGAATERMLARYWQLGRGLSGAIRRGWLDDVARAAGARDG